MYILDSEDSSQVMSIIKTLNHFSFASQTRTTSASSFMSKMSTTSRLISSIVLCPCKPWCNSTPRPIRQCSPYRPAIRTVTITYITSSCETEVSFLPLPFPSSPCSNVLIMPYDSSFRRLLWVY